MNQRERIFWVMAAILFGLIVIVCAGAVWVMQDTHHLLDTAAPTTVPAPVTGTIQTQTTPLPLVTIEPENGISTDSSIGIALPAESLNEGHKDTLAQDPSAIALVASKIGERPLAVPLRSAATDQTTLAEQDYDVITLDTAEEKTHGKANGTGDAARTSDLAAAKIIHFDDETPEPETQTLPSVAHTLPEDPLMMKAEDLEEIPASRVSGSVVTQQIIAARAALNRGDMDQTITHFDRAVRLAPGNPAYRLGLAIAYDRAEQNTAALGVYRQVLTLIADQDEPSPTPLPTSTIRARVSYLETMVMP